MATAIPLPEIAPPKEDMLSEVINGQVVERTLGAYSTWDVVPDPAVEIISPSNTADGVMAKVEEYFRAGSRLVWAIDPNQCQVYAYESPTSVRILQVGDDLDGGAVVPGFRLPVAVLFEDEPEAPPTP